MFRAPATIHDSENKLSLQELKVLDEVNRNVCVHGNLSDIQILVERDCLWNSQVRKFSAVLRTMLWNHVHTLQKYMNQNQNGRCR